LEVLVEDNWAEMCAQAGAKYIENRHGDIVFANLSTGLLASIPAYKVTVTSIRDMATQSERWAEMCAQAGAKYIENRDGDIVFANLKTGILDSIRAYYATVASIKEKVVQSQPWDELCAQAGAKYIENRGGDIVFASPKTGVRDSIPAFAATVASIREKVVQLELWDELCAQAGAKLHRYEYGYIHFMCLSTESYDAIHHSEITVASLKEKVRQAEPWAEMCAQAGAKLTSVGSVDLFFITLKTGALNCIPQSDATVASIRAKVVRADDLATTKVNPSDGLARDDSEQEQEDVSRIESWLESSGGF
jgi:hypothetical protein